MSTSLPVVYIGIDVSKDKLDIFLRPLGQALSIANQASAIEQWSRSLSAYQVERIVLEATGGLETLAASLLANQGLPVVIVNPRQVSHFTKAFGQLAKTDALDAQGIAHFAEVVRPSVQIFATALEKELKDLITRRQQLIQMHTAESNRLRSLSGVAGQSIERTLAFLEQQLADLDQRLQRLIQESPLWREKEDLLTTIPGIGPTVSRTLVAMLPELGTLTPKQISALVGLAPYNHDSGKMKGRRRIYGGRALVRHMLYMAAVSVTRTKSRFAEFYQRLLQKGKPRKVALIACAHKILITANAVLRDLTAWDKKRFSIEKTT